MRSANARTVGVAAITPQRTKLVDAILERELAERHIAGASLAIVRDGAVLYAKGYGFADLGRRVPVRADTRFLIASITKMFTAVAVMTLARDGKLEIDAPIGPVVRDLPEQWQRVTVRQLLRHTSGVPSFTAFDAPPCGRQKAEAEYDATDVIDEVDCLPLEFEPGTDWRYSDTGYHLLGLIIEREWPFLRNVLARANLSSTRDALHPPHREGWSAGRPRRGLPLAQWCA
jgi:CubicO group peptidase (beta-lactamase class C family)